MRVRDKTEQHGPWEIVSSQNTISITAIMSFASLQAWQGFANTRARRAGGSHNGDDDNDDGSLPDSPPYGQPAGRADRRAFATEFPHIIDGQRYIHNPNRRIDRAVPTDTNTRTCDICHRILLPYRPGKCPACWRNRFGTFLSSLNAVPRRLCICPCQCPAELDDPNDSDYIPDGQSEENTSAAPTPAPSSPKLLASSLWLDDTGDIVQRHFYAEDPNQHAAAAQVEDPDDEFSSLHNDANSITPAQASHLIRPLYRMEILGLLGTGYTRDEVRRHFYETNITTASSYLPPDGLIQPDGPPSCDMCMRNYSPDLRDAITVVIERRELRRRITERHPADLAFTRGQLRQRLNALRSLPAVKLCPLCALPRRQAGQFQGQPYHCSCRCLCPPELLPPPSTPPGSLPSDSGSNSDSAVSPTWIP